MTSFIYFQTCLIYGATSFIFCRKFYISVKMFYLKSNKFYIFNDKFYILQEVFLIQTAFHRQVTETGTQHARNEQASVLDSEIRETCFIIIIGLSYDSCLKVVFTRHSGFADSNLPRVFLENFSATPPRGQKRVVDVTD